VLRELKNEIKILKQPKNFKEEKQQDGDEKQKIN
jgi:hypothetical protein